MSDFLLDAAWINRLSHLNDLYVGFSGGLDSTVLLHALCQNPSLRKKVKAIHINHGLMPSANQWQSHCEQFCKQQAISFDSYHVQIHQRVNIEEQARNERYRIFNAILQPGDAILTAHHEEDQAETVLLHLMRGSGIDGLAAMEADVSFGKGWLARPLLACKKQSLIAYAEKHALRWVEDESNQDEHYLRNFVRRSVIPLLKTKCPSVIQNIARTASHCLDAKINLDFLAQMDCPTATNGAEVLSLESIAGLPRERLTNVLRSWLKTRGCKSPSTKVMSQLIDNVILADSNANPEVSFGGSSIRRFRNQLFYLKKTLKNTAATVGWSTFPAPIQSMHHAMTIYAVYTTGGFSIPKEASIELRFRRGGETIRLRGQTKQLKKLYQEWGVPPWLRKEVPLLYVDNVLFAVVGYAISDHAFFMQQRNTVGFKVCSSLKMIANVPKKGDYLKLENS